MRTNETAPTVMDLLNFGILENVLLHAHDLA